jgi:hypothetical protein
MIEVNPFDDLIVNEPRRPEMAVSGLNEKPLQTLLSQFQRLSEGTAPREQRSSGRALLITSVQPGFGKSHLISRLFRSLHERATLIYVRPFQNSSLAFQSLLATVVREMHFPDRMDAEAWRPSEPTQLDALACSVLAHLVADLIEADPQGDQADAKFLRSDPVNAFGEGLDAHPWGKWMRETFVSYLAAYEQALARRNVRLNSPEWLRVLFAYAFNYPDRDIRQAAQDWMAGHPLSAEQGALLGLRPAELLAAEAPAEELNHVSRLRLIDLCRLACLYRPFVFCFDQTESYGHAALLARSLGMVIATLVNEANNHLTMVTSNQAPWNQTIKVHFENADSERIEHPPLILEGLTRRQGEELIRLRLADRSVEPAMLAGMLAKEWLQEEFQTDEDQRGARRFLQLCKERWEKLRSQPPPPAVNLDQLYEERRLKLLADPKRLLFDADALQWLVKVCAAGLPGLKIHPNGAGYFTIGWEASARRVLFGFEAGSNWKRWAAIARHAQDRAVKNPPLKAVFFRDGEQPPIPGPTWKVAGEIQAAKQEVLHLIILTRDDLAVLYAGSDLHAEALGGDIAPHTAEDVLVFLRQRFRMWWQKLMGPIDGSSAAPTSTDDIPEELGPLVRDIVSRHKFLSINEVIAQLPGVTAPEDVLKACRYYEGIRVHVHPNMTVLQWQNL